MIENIDKCIFCGADLVDGVCPNIAQHFKPMCLNCSSMKYEDGKNYCDNEANKLEAIEKIKLAVPSGYELANIDLKPLPLKDDTKKCKRWHLNSEAYLWSNALSFMLGNLASNKKE